MTETAGGTSSADRVADVLLLFGSADGPLGVSEAARRLQISKAVVHRVIQSLCSRSLLRAVPRSAGYVLGPAAISLGRRDWGLFDVRSLAAPILRKLRDETRETTTLSVLIGDSRIYLDQFESPQEVKMIVEIGPQYPLHSGASSRSILAFLPEGHIQRSIGQLKVLNPELDVDEYRRDLARVRAAGYAISMNERNTGAASIAAPFFDESGKVLGSISSSGPVFRYQHSDHRREIEKVLTAAQQITRLLGG